MSAGCTLSPSLMLGLGLEQIPVVSVGSEQRPLPYFPLLSPSSTLSSDQHLPRVPFWLQEKQAQPSTARCSLLHSLLPWLLPVPLPLP